MWDYPPETPPITVGTLLIDWDRAVVTMEGKQVPFSWTEISLLAALAHAHGRVLSRAWLIDAIWQNEDRNLDHLKNIVGQTRRKLGPEAWRLKTVVGMGYRLDCD